VGVFAKIRQTVKNQADNNQQSKEKKYYVQLVFTEDKHNDNNSKLIIFSCCRCAGLLTVATPQAASLQKYYELTIVLLQSRQESENEHGQNAKNGNHDPEFFYGFSFHNTDLNRLFDMDLDRLHFIIFIVDNPFKFKAWIAKIEQ